MNKCNLKNTAVFLQDSIDDNIIWLWILLSIRYSNQRYLKPKESTNNLQNFLSNKEGVELINVPHIFHDPAVKASLSTDIKINDSTIVYSFLNKIRLEI